MTNPKFKVGDAVWYLYKAWAEGNRHHFIPIPEEITRVLVDYDTGEILYKLSWQALPEKDLYLTEEEAREANH